MRKIFFIAFISLFLSSLVGKTQLFQSEEAILIREFNNYQSAMGKTLSKVDLAYSQISGSPFFNEDFIESEIISTDSIRYVNVKLRYNIYTDELEYLMDGGLLTLANPRDFMYFIMGEDVFIYQPYQLPASSPKRGYFQLLTSGPSASLSKKFNIFYEPPKEPQAYASAQPARFKRNADSYFIRFPGSLPTEISLNRRRVLSVFPDKTKELEKFISDKRLNFRNENDLISLIEYYNNL